jgi:antitoxin component YwqK of YwqJK toxin-antitoxin module
MYRSSIPKSARERVTDRDSSGAKLRAEYILRGKIVGVRWFHEPGEPSFETPLKDDVYHGTVYRWDIPGILLSSEPYVSGLAHGIARQWSDDGKLIGIYKMKRGTGIDLWWGGCNGAFSLSEVHYLKDGRPHGYEWWLDDDKKVNSERHWRGGLAHGIERDWNAQGRLRRGYPRYYLHGERVNKRRYERACDSDSSLPKFRQKDNEPKRKFPPEVAKFFKRKKA